MVTERSTLDAAALVLSDRDDANILSTLRATSEHVRKTYVIGPCFGAEVHAAAERLGTTLVAHPHPGPIDQLNYLLENFAEEHSWFLCLQSGEHLTRGAIEAASKACRQQTATALSFSCKQRFRGRELRWGASKQSESVRMWRFDTTVETRMDMQGRLVLSAIASRALKVGSLVCEHRETLTQWTARMNRRASVAVLRLHEEGQNGRFRTAFSRGFSTWFTCYILRLGFLDGRAGLLWHFLNHFWLPLLIQVKTHEAFSAKAASTSNGWIRQTETFLGIDVGQSAARRK